MLHWLFLLNIKQTLFHLLKSSGPGLCCDHIERIITEVLWSSQWTVGSLRFVHLHNENRFARRVIDFFSSFTYPGHFMVCVLTKAEDAYLAGEPGLCSQFWLIPSYLFVFFFFVRVILINLCFFVVCIRFPCLIFMLSARILVPFNSFLQYLTYFTIN